MRDTSAPITDRDGEFWFDAAAADLACDFFERYLVHTVGEWANRPFVPEPWQRDRIIRPAFGWKRTSNGTRRFRTVYCAVPRKNGKSTLAAGIALRLTFGDLELGAQVFSAAADRDQAAIVFDEARRMRDASPALVARSHAYKRAIVVPKLAASYKTLSADAYTKHGLNAHGILFDELHTQTGRDLWDVLRTSTGARRQPMTVAITTAGHDRHSLCWEVHDYAMKVAAGIIDDPEFLPVIYAADETDDWTDPSVWAKANPSLGRTIKREYLEAECRRAQEIPAYENTFKQLHLNIWTEQAVRWLPMDRWDGAAPRAPLESFHGRPCWAGLDLSTTTDITALVLVFPADDGALDVVPFFWVPAENLKRRVERDRVPYDLWVREGLIRTTEGNVVDYDQIRADINALGERFDLREIAIDRWNATQITTQLAGDGFTMVPFGQGFQSMSAPSKEIERRVLDGSLRHGGNKVLRWMAANAAIRQDPAGNIKPAKDRSTGRIDGIVALAMALGRVMVREPAKPSLADALIRRGLISV